MMNKRGQVTVFVIVGIVILVTVFLVFYFLGDNIKQDTEIEVVFDESSLEPTIKLVEDCVKEEILKGIELIGLQGGYYNPPEFSQVGDYQVSYNCHKDEGGNYINRLPLLERISGEVEEYISASDSLEIIEECIDGFNFYKDQGYKIDYENIRNMDIDIAIGKNIIVDVGYPVKIEKGDFVSSFEGVKFQISTGLLSAYKVATVIINDECTGVVFNVDDYIISNPPLATIARQFFPNIGYFYYLTTIPQGGEEVYRFNFIVER